MAAAGAGAAVDGRDEARALQRGVPLDRGGHADRRAEHHLGVLGQPVEGGDGAGGQVVGGRDRPERLARLDGVRRRQRKPVPQGEKGEAVTGCCGARGTSVVSGGGVCSDSRHSSRATRRAQLRSPAGPCRAPAELRRAASDRAVACARVDRADVKLWAQKWRWYERNALPWNRARIHREFARRRAFCRWPVHGNVLEMLPRAGSSSASTCCSSRASGSPPPRPAGS